MRQTSASALIGIVALSLSPTLFAQHAPPIPGVTGTLVTPETAKDEKKAEDKAAVAVKDAVTPTDKGPLSDLRPGSTVIVRYGTANVDEGIVTKVDRSSSEITVRYENKRIEKLQLADKGAGATKLVVYTDEAGQKIERYFKPKS